MNHRLSGNINTIIPSRPAAPVWWLAVAFIGFWLVEFGTREVFHTLTNEPQFGNLPMAAHALTAALILHVFLDISFFTASFRGMTEDWVWQRITDSKLVSNPPYIVVAFHDLLQAVLARAQARWICLYSGSLLISLVGFFTFIQYVRKNQAMTLQRAPFELLIYPVGECIAVAVVLALASAWARYECSIGERKIADHVNSLYNTGAIAALVSVPAENAAESLMKARPSRSETIEDEWGRQPFGDTPFGTTGTNESGPFGKSTPFDDGNPFDASGGNPFGGDDLFNAAGDNPFQ